MAEGSILDEVDQRTQLAGKNRLELLLFTLENGQRFGINVFKVREAIPCPKLTKLPYSHPIIRGAAHIRDKTISIFDLAMGIGMTPIQNVEKKFVIITEYNRSVQGFLVNTIDRIINISWSEILPQPRVAGNNYVTAITQIDNELIEIIDVEKVLAEVIGSDETVTADLAEQFSEENQMIRPHILVADDSSVARNQIKRTMEQVGVDCTLVYDGRQALEQLQQWADEGVDLKRHLALLVSDIEMPEMDGYTLTTQVRKDPRFNGLKILLHSSMSGTFNNMMVDKVGADKFIPKFSPDDLAIAVQEMIEQWKQDMGMEDEDKPELES